MYASSIVWLLPIFRQYKSNFFYFFLILGLMDPLTILFVSVLGLVPQGLIFSVGSLILFFSIDNSIQRLLEQWIINSLLTVVCFLMIFYLPTLEILVALIHMLILFKFIKIIVVQMHKDSEFNFFYLVLIFYELSLIINLVVHFSVTETSVTLFYATVFFQMLVAIFFTIFREDSPLLTIRTKFSN